MLTENNSKQTISSFMNADYTLSRDDFIKLLDKETVAAGNGLRGDYFANKELEGKPVISKTDANLDLSWQDGAPGEAVDTNFFSVRWQGRLKAPGTGTYTIKAVSDDGVRIWIGGKLIIDSWVPQNDVARAGTIKFKENTFTTSKWSTSRTKAKPISSCSGKDRGGRKRSFPESAFST